MKILKTVLIIPLLLSLTACAGLLVASGGGEGGSVASAADQDILSKINRAYVSEPSIKATAIRVSVSDGVVTLSGKVGSVKVMKLALKIARSTQGVKRVSNRLYVVSGY